MTSRAVLAGAVVVAGSLLLACQPADEAAPPRPDPRPTRPPTSAPAVDSDDLRRITVELIERRNQVFVEDPDPGRIGEYADPAAAELVANDERDLGQLDAAEAHLDGSPLAVLGVVLAPNPGDESHGQITLHAVVETTTVHLVDADGVVLEQLDGGDRLVLAIGISDRGGSWLVVDWTELQLPSEEVDLIITAGLPG